MFGNFTYHNPTKLIFGKDAMNALATELAAYSVPPSSSSTAAAPSSETASTTK